MKHKSNQDLYPRTSVREYYDIPPTYEAYFVGILRQFMTRHDLI